MDSMLLVMHVVQCAQTLTHCIIRHANPSKIAEEMTSPADQGDSSACSLTVECDFNEGSGLVKVNGDYHVLGLKNHQYAHAHELMRYPRC